MQEEIGQKFLQFEEKLSKIIKYLVLNPNWIHHWNRNMKEHPATIRSSPIQLQAFIVTLPDTIQNLHSWRFMIGGKQALYKTP